MFVIFCLGWLYLSLRFKKRFGVVVNLKDWCVFVGFGGLFVECF